jgi:hypothetical protein
MTDDMSALRAALAARVGRCWERLDDVATELHAVHGVPVEAIVDYLRRTVEVEPADG